MNENTGQSEEIQHTLYLDTKRNWVSEVESPFYHNKVFFMKDGKIGIEFCGRVFVKSIDLWASLGLAQEQE